MRKTCKRICQLDMKLRYIAIEWLSRLQSSLNWRSNVCNITVCDSIVMPNSALTQNVNDNQVNAHGNYFICALRMGTWWRLYTINRTIQCRGQSSSVTLITFVVDWGRLLAQTPGNKLTKFLEWMCVTVHYDRKSTHGNNRLDLVMTTQQRLVGYVTLVGSKLGGSDHRMVEITDKFPVQPL